MNRRTLALLYPAAALGLATLIYVAGRIRRSQQTAESRPDALQDDTDLQDHDVYIRRIREYERNRARP